MTSDLLLRRKWTLRAHGAQVVFLKRKNERSAHVMMKAFLWALYLPQFPDLQVEINIGDRYRPDVVSLGSDPLQPPRFWGEAGQVGVAKIRSLLRRFPSTHLAIAKWESRLDPLREIVDRAGRGLRRHAPIDLLCFEADSPERFVDARGYIEIDHDQIDWMRLEP